MSGARAPRADRELVAIAIKNLGGFGIVLPEDLPASGQGTSAAKQLASIRNRVAGADVVVVVLEEEGVAHMRGAERIPQVEYEIAVSMGIPVMVFASDKAQKLNDGFAKRLLEQHPVSFFHSPADLGSSVASGLTNWRRQATKLPDKFDIIFAPNLSPDQVRRCLEALADYYRACRGVGLDPDFELAEVLVEEPADVLA